jgi:hypothetical protein
MENGNGMDTYRTYVEFTPAEGQEVTESEFDRFSRAASEVEESIADVLECHVNGDLEEHVIGLECVVAAASLGAAQVLVDWIASTVAHRVDVLAGRAGLVTSGARAELLAPA